MYALSGARYCTCLSCMMLILGCPGMVCQPQTNHRAAPPAMRLLQIMSLVKRAPAAHVSSVRVAAPS
jgi:hypothetical protein